MELQDQYLKHSQLTQISHSMKQKQQDRIVVQKLIKVAILSLTFMSVQIVGGYFAGSIAILADAFHLLSDVMAYAISLFAVLYSKKIAPESLTFGYEKLQPLGALANVAIIWVVTVELCIQATSRIINKDVVHQPWIMLGTSFFGLCCNLVIMKILHSDPDSGHNCGIDHGTNNPHKHDGNCSHSHGNATVHNFNQDHLHDSAHSSSQSHKHSSNCTHGHSHGVSNHAHKKGHGDGHAHVHSSKCSHSHSHKHSHGETHGDQHQHKKQNNKQENETDKKVKEHEHVHSAGCSHNHKKPNHNDSKPIIMKRELIDQDDQDINNDNSGDKMQDSADKMQEKEESLGSRHQLSLVDQIGQNRVAIPLVEYSINENQIVAKEDSDRSNDSQIDQDDILVEEETRIFDNINIQAAYIHIISDIILSIGVIISAIMIVVFTHNQQDGSKIWTAWELVDPCCTYFFSIMAIYSTIKITKDSVVILLDGCDKPAIVKHVKREIKHLNSCKELLDLKIWTANRGKYYGIVKAISDKQAKFKRDVTKIMKKRNIDCFIDVSS